MLEVTFRADAAPHIGAGHLMRCFALAHSIRAAGGRVHLVTSYSSPYLEKWVDEIDASIHLDELAGPGTENDLFRTLKVVEATDSDWLVIDTYAATSEWISKCAKASRTMLIDDLGGRDANVDVVLNQNAGAEVRYASSYTRCSQAWLGTRWFLRGPQWGRHIYLPDDRRLLVTLGAGCDATGHTRAIVNALAEDRRHWKADVVVIGGPSPDWPLVEAQGNRMTYHTGPVDLSGLMTRAKVVICGGGVTALEALSVGVVPVVVVLADNQRPGALSLASLGAALTLEAVQAPLASVAVRAVDLLHNPVELARFRQSGQVLVDGLGAERAARAMAILH